jgi:hypothetical protein
VTESGGTVDYGRPDYIIVRRPAEGLAIIAHPSGDTALWARRKLRKSCVCPGTNERLQPGDLAYGPIGNQQYRAVRISASLIDALPVDRPHTGRSS